MVAWLPKLFVLGLAVAAVAQACVNRRILAWACGAIFPILYDVVKVVWNEGISSPDNPHFWSHDLPILFGIALLATMPGAFAGTAIGGWMRRLASVR